MLKMTSVSQYSAPAIADGTFAFTGVVPGTYALSARFSPPPGTPADAWMVKSIQSGGRDVSDAPIDVRQGADVSDVVITFTDRTSEVSGTIFDANGKPAPGYFVFLFPAERLGLVPVLAPLPAAVTAVDRRQVSGPGAAARRLLRDRTHRARPARHPRREFPAAVDDRGVQDHASRGREESAGHQDQVTGSGLRLTA